MRQRAPNRSSTGLVYSGLQEDRILTISKTQTLLCIILLAVLTELLKLKLMDQIKDSQLNLNFKQIANDFFGISMSQVLYTYIKNAYVKIGFY